MYYLSEQRVSVLSPILSIHPHVCLGVPGLRRPQDHANSSAKSWEFDLACGISVAFLDTRFPHDQRKFGFTEFIHLRISGVVATLI